MISPDLDIRGALVWKDRLDAGAQSALLAAVEDIAGKAPFRRPMTPWGKPMSVEMTSAGRYGWITDRSGYRYEPLQPDGSPWPPVPSVVLSLWRDFAAAPRSPDCCLVNRYGASSRMGLHQDRDEGDFSYPVLSLSLGDDALFRIGGESRKGTTESVWLSSGDIVLMTGPSRLAYHGIDRIRAGSSALFPAGGRINLTLRVVDLRKAAQDRPKDATKMTSMPDRKARK